MLRASLAGLLCLAAVACGATGGDVGSADAAAHADHPVGSGGATPSAGGAGGQVTQSGGAGGKGGGAGGAAGRGGSGGGAGGASGQGGLRDGGAGAGGRDVRPTDAPGPGTGGTPSADAGPVACDDITSPGRLGVYYYSNSAATGSSVQMYFDVVNFTAFSAQLSQVTIRYWFTDEDPTSANQLEQYYVPIPTAMKFNKVNPPRQGADTVLEISFTGAGDAGASFVETRGFNFAFHKASYAGTYDQTNDYSYDPNLKTALGKNPRITAYVKGQLVWGCEPPLLPPTAIDGGSSAPADAAASEPVDSQRGER